MIIKLMQYEIGTLSFWIVLSDNETLFVLAEKKEDVDEEVLKELSVKEAKIFRSKEVLSERFCELLPFALKINKQDISGFYFILDYTIKEKFKNNNLSENDFLQLFACYINKNLILVTEDKALLEIGGCIVKKEWVISLSDLYNIEND